LTLEVKRIAALVSGKNHTPSPQAHKRSLGSVFGRQGSTGSLELAEVPDTA
jgi:hypothetical protein